MTALIACALTTFGDIPNSFMFGRRAVYSTGTTAGATNGAKEGRETSSIFLVMTNGVRED